MNAGDRKFWTTAMRLAAAIEIAQKTGALPNDNERRHYEFSDSMILEYQKTGEISADWTPDYRIGEHRNDLDGERRKTTYLFENIRNEAKFLEKAGKNKS